MSAHDRTFHVLGVPLRTGSLYPGSENDSQAYRDVDLVGRLRAAGASVVDDGDVAIPSYLPHHAIPPIKNWPGPRIAWDCIGERIAPLLEQPGQVPMLIGADCSVVVGTTQALMRRHGRRVHVLYVDGDIDGIAPDPSRCMSAAGMALWLATQANPFRPGPEEPPSQVTVIGWSDDLGSPAIGLGSVPLADMRRVGPGEAARRALDAVPDGAPVLLHLDIDVVRKSEMPAAYFPHPDGLTLAECRDLLRPILADPRLAVVEVAEYAALRDPDHAHVDRIAGLLASALSTGS